VKCARGSEHEYIAKSANGYILATNGYFNGYIPERQQPTTATKIRRGKIHDAGIFGNNLKPGGGSEGLRSTKDDQASAGNFVRGFSSFPINLSREGLLLGPKVLFEERILRLLYFVAGKLMQEVRGL